MFRLTPLRVFVMLIFISACVVEVNYVFAGTPTQIPFGESTLGGYDLHSTSMTFGDTWHFTVAVPSNYTKNSIKLEVSGSSCLSMYVNTPCSSTSGSSSSCITSASAGQQVDFNVEVYFGYCKGYNPGSFYVKVSEVVLKNDGESCSSLYECKSYHCASGKCYTPKYGNGSYCYNASECQGGFCNNNECASSPLTCGNGSCDSEETSYNCPIDCPLQYDNGYACESVSQCKNGYCVHNKCRSSATYCGDYYCEGTETCDNCYTDCMSQCKYNDGTGCSSADKCKGGYCVHNVCRSSSSYCGDKYCDTDLESCFYCPTDCGVCPVVKKDNGQSCSANSECKNGYCVHGYCRSDYVYCGDTYCDSEESCSSCSTDCGSCPVPAQETQQEVVTTPTPVETPVQESTASQPTQKVVKTYKIKTIADVNVKENGSATQKIQMIYSPDTWKEETKKSPLTNKTLREMEKSLVAAYKHGGIVAKNVKISVNKAKYTLIIGAEFANYAELGKLRGFMDFPDLLVIDLNSVSLLSSSCKRDDYNVNITGSNRIIMNAVCTESFSYQSGNVQNEIQMQFAIRQNINLPAKADGVEFNKDSFLVHYKIVQPKKDIGVKCKIDDDCKSGYCKKNICAKAVILEVELPQQITLKKAEKYKMPITIINESKSEVTLGESIILSDWFGFIVEGDATELKMYKQTLQPGEIISTKAEQSEDSINQLTLTGKTPGSGKFTLKFDYSANGKSQQFSAKIPVVVKNTHINQDQTATNLFKKNMVLEEKSGDYVFVKPDANPQYEAVVYNWGKANGSFDDELHNLATDVADEFKPEVVGFVETVKDLNEAETPKAITETLLRSLAPSIIFGVSDFIELGKAATKLQAEEKSFLKLFNAKEFINIPVYNENGEKVGLAKSIIKKSGGKTYAVKIGVINLISFSDF